MAAAKASQRPLVMHAHALETDRSGEFPDRRIEALERQGLVSADRTICVSEVTRAQVEQQYKVPANRLRVVHNAVTHKARRPAPTLPANSSGPVVLFLGRVTMQKGPEYFLRAAAKALESRATSPSSFLAAGTCWRT